MSRAATAGELTYFRTPGQRSQLFLAFRLPGTIYACQVDGSPSGNNANFPNDMVGELDFDNATGTLGDVKVGMTVWVGSSAGAKDKGMCYIRKTPIAGTLYVGETSEIDWDDDDHLTIVDDFQIWARHIKIVSGSALIDFDIAYSDQHADFDPRVNFGGDVVLWRTGDTVSIALDASGSAVFGSSISSYLFTAPGAQGVSGAATATPTITYDSDGQFVVYCQVTAANGKTHTGARIVWVFSEASMPETDFVLDDCTLNYEDGGCQFSVTMPFDADVTEVLERTKVVLFAKDWYGDTEISIGAETGRENILAEGWIAKESINWDFEQDTVSFTVYGGQEWLKKIPAFPIGLEMATTAAAWTDMEGLTVDRAVWHLLHWRSTFSIVGDMNLTSDTRYAKELAGASSSLWEQMREMAHSSIFASCGVDWFGSFYCMVEPQLVPTGSRSGWPTIMTITEQDWHETMEIERQTVSPVSMVSLSGVTVDVSGTASAIFSLAHGHVFKRYGDVEIIDRLLLSSQTQANTLAGLYMGWKNNELPNFIIEMACNMRLCTLWPAQYFAIAIQATDTERGFAYTGNLIPRTIDYEYDAEAGVLLTSIWCEAETEDVLNINGDIPVGDGTFVDMPSLPKLPKLPKLPPLDSFLPGIISPDAEEVGPANILLHTQNFGFIYSTNYNEASPEWFFMNTGLPETVKDYCKRVIRTPSGALFAAMHEAPYSQVGFDYLYYATGLGASWVLLADKTTLGLTGTTPRLAGLGYNWDAEEEIAVAGASASPSEDLGKVFTGSSSGLTVLASGLNMRRTYWDMHCLDGSWGAVHAISDIFTRQGYSEIGVSNGVQFPLGQTYSASYHPSIKGGDIVYHWNNDMSYLRKITAFGFSASNTTRPYVGVLGDNSFALPKLLVCDPTGQYLMGSGGSTLGKRSSDYGVTWGNISATLSVGYKVWENHGTPNAFSAFTTQTIKYTNDFGDTWVDKSGNLATLAPLCTANHIQHISW